MSGRQDHLVFGGCDLVELARTYGTPLHVVDEAQLQANFTAFRQAFAAREPSTEICYSYKTNCVPGLLEILHASGCGAEVASPYEYWLATRLGVAPASMVFNGVNRSLDDFEAAIRAGVSLINVDSLGEASRLVEAADRSQMPVRVGVRIDPGIGWKAHFGVQAKTQHFAAIVQALERSKWVGVCGVHAHIGSCIRETHVYERAIERLAEAIAQVRTREGIDTFDVGGGFGVATVERFSVGDAGLYRLLNRPPAAPSAESCASFDQFSEAIVSAVHRACARDGITLRRLILEPGRAISGNAQILLVSVKDTKVRASGSRFALTDGGMQNVAFPVSYEYHRCVVANRAGEAATERWFVTGPLCSAEDLLYRNWPLPPLHAGDVLAIMDAGAYFTSFANNFSYPKPPVVLASNGTARVLRPRESFEDMAG